MIGSERDLLTFTSMSRSRLSRTMMPQVVSVTTSRQATPLLEPIGGAFEEVQAGELASPCEYRLLSICTILYLPHTGPESRSRTNFNLDSLLPVIEQNGKCRCYDGTA
jgi:hypothetical protein